MQYYKFFAINFIDNAIEIVERPTTKVNCHVVLVVHTIPIENGVIALVIDAPNRDRKMKAADAVFLAIVNQPDRWNYSTQTSNGVMVNAAETIAMA